MRHEQDTTGNLKKLLLPIFAFTPETHLGMGGLGVALWKNKHPTITTRTSNAELAMLYTTRGQTIIVPRYFIFTKGEHYLIDGYGQGLFEYHDYYFGRGNESSSHNRELVTYNLVGLENKIQRRAFAHEKIFVGIEFRYLHYYQLELTDGGLLQTGKVTGYQGATAVGLGPTVTWDTRDNVVNPSKGFYIDLRTTVHSVGLGGNVNYHRMIADFRKYFDVVPSLRHVLAFQLNGNFVRGDAPFKELAELGGFRTMRGYYRGRFRDNYMTAFQAEYRVPVYRWFGVVAFAGLGKVYDPNSVNFDGLHYSYGGGIRVQVSKRDKLNLRLDYGRGDPHYLGYFYVGFAEAF